MPALSPFDLQYFLSLAPDWQGRATFFASIGSTNQVAKEQLRQTEPDAPFLLIADQQTAGRGRLGRQWQAPPATGLLSSLAFPLGVQLEKAYLYTASMALSVQKAVGQNILQIKWPNDLLRDGRKVGGILAELERNASWLVLGCGLNVSLSESDFEAAGLADRATNLTAPDGPPIVREQLLADILHYFEQYRTTLQTQLASVHAEWATALVTIGRRVQVWREGQLDIEGLAERVEPDGRLIVLDASGRSHAVQAGDVSLSR